MNARKELLRYPRDRNVVDIDLFIADERQQQVQRSGELRKLDDEAVLLALISCGVPRDGQYVERCHSPPTPGSRKLTDTPTSKRVPAIAGNNHQVSNGPPRNSKA